MDTELYKMGWLLVAFDLPTLSKKERKAAHDFREWLKEQILTTPLIEECDFDGVDIMDSTPPAVRQPNTAMPLREYNFGSGVTTD